MKKTNELNDFFNKPTSLWTKFHRRSKIAKFPQSILEPRFWPENWIKQYYKGYPRLSAVALPKPNGLEVKLTKVLMERRSRREFSRKPLDLTKLSKLFYYSAGLIKVGSSGLPRRFYPSAGARFPLELYFISLKSSLEQGLYHYYVRTHCLEKLFLFNRFSYKKYFNQSWTQKASGFIIITGVFNRTIHKYGERGYRYILIETGHLGQNISLICQGLKISCCAIGGFADDKINDLLDIDSKNESVLYVLAIG